MRGTLPRARERVIHHLREEFEKLDLPDGARIPTSRSLAAQLDVSVSTVQTVFRQLAEEGVIRTIVGNGSFLVRPNSSAPGSLKRIGVTFGFTEDAVKSEPWHLAICGSILSAASTRNALNSVVPIQMPASGASAGDVIKFLESVSGKVDGIILRPLKCWPEVRKRLSPNHPPVVHLNATEFSATRNFVSSDFFHSGLQSARAFMASGRKSIVFMHSLPEQIGISTSLCISGMVTALGNAITSRVGFEACCASAAERESGYEAAKRIFEGSRKKPDAIYTVTVNLAFGVMDYCESAGINIPGDLSVMSGGALDPHAGAQGGLTQDLQDISRIGSELVDMILKRIEDQGRDIPGVFARSKFIGGETTLPAENEVLGIVR